MSSSLKSRFSESLASTLHYVMLMFWAAGFSILVLVFRYFVIDRYGLHFDQEYQRLVEVMTNIIALHYVFAVNNVWQDGRNKKRLIKFAVLEHKHTSLTENEKPFIDFMKAAAGKVDSGDHFFSGVTGSMLVLVMLVLDFHSLILEFFTLGITSFIVAFFLLIIVDSHNIYFGYCYRKMGIPTEWLDRLKSMNGG
jgi:hypothetical protein